MPDGSENLPGPVPAQPADTDVSEGQLPEWAQEAPRRRRFISRRNIALALLALVVVGFLVWINFPFIPDPVILLGRQPEVVFDSASSGENWTMHGRTLGLTRYAPDVVNEPQGELAWSSETGPATLAAPVVADGMVYLGAHFRIAVLDAETGQEVASAPATGPIGNSLALADGTLYYTMPDRRLVARDTTTHSIIWEYQMGDATSGPVSVANGIVYAGALDGITYAVNATTGELVWQHESLGEVKSPASLADDFAFVASADRSLYALDSAHRTGTGEVPHRGRAGRRAGYGQRPDLLRIRAQIARDGSGRTGISGSVRGDPHLVAIVAVAVPAAGASVAARGRVAFRARLSRGIPVAPEADRGNHIGAGGGRRRPLRGRYPGQDVQH